MRILDIPQSGKCGTFVSVRTRYGQIRRRRGVIRKSPSAAQVRNRSNFARVVALWRFLTEAQRAAWTLAGADTSSRPKLAQSGSLPGYLLFIKINSVLAYQGKELLVTPPAPVTFEPNPVGSLVVTNTGGVPELKLSVSSTPAATILVLATHPRSAGVSFANHFTILGVLPAAEGGYSNITDLFVARYGKPTVGTRIFIRTRQVRDGWEDLPKQTAALVPQP